jgi:nucleoside-diphosphate-sugar epimerase
MARPNTALVVGATGFVGAALARRLIAEGVRVAGLVRPQSSRARPRDLPGVELIELTDFRAESLTAALRQVRPELVYNLAAHGVSAGGGDVEAMLRSNVELVVELVRAAAEVGSVGVVHTGSCFEYAASPANDDLTEDDPLRPFSLYGATKAASVLLAEGLARHLGVALATMRLFGVYGPGESPERLVPCLVQKLREGEPVDLTEGTQVRDLLYVEDAAEAFWRAGCRLPALAGRGPFNVCSGRGVSVCEIGNLVAEHLQCPPELLRWGARPDRPGEPERIVGDPRRFRAATGWTPTTPLAAGLRHTISHLLKTEVGSDTKTLVANAAVRGARERRRDLNCPGAGACG